MDIEKDERTLADLAQEAMNVQYASNLSGVVLSWSRSIMRLRELIRDSPGFGTEMVNRHPINLLFAEKVGDMTNCIDPHLLANAMLEVTDLAQGDGHLNSDELNGVSPGDYDKIAAGMISYVSEAMAEGGLTPQQQIEHFNDLLVQAEINRTRAATSLEVGKANGQIVEIKRKLSNLRKQHNIWT